MPVKSGIGKEVDEEQLANQLYVLMQPTRRKIVKLLQSGEPMYIDQIAKAIDEDRRAVSFHLLTLAEHGFVEGDFQLIEKATKNPGAGRGAKFYHLTSKVDPIIKLLDTILK
jgi:predicted ArsR family transcriptional regulator